MGFFDELKQELELLGHVVEMPVTGAVWLDGEELDAGFVDHMYQTMSVEEAVSALCD